MKIFVVYVWMTMAYMPWDIVKVGEFANCEQGVATAQFISGIHSTTLYYT